MMFEMPENIEILDDTGIQKLQEKLDVNISIKPKQRQANKSVLIKAQVSLTLDYYYQKFNALEKYSSKTRILIHETKCLLLIGAQCFQYIQGTTFLTRFGR